MDSKHIKHDWPINCRWNARASKFVGTTETRITNQQERAALQVSSNFDITSHWSCYSICKLIFTADDK